jgi:hypothetical protein
MHASYDGRACDSMKRKLPIGGASITAPRENEAKLRDVLIELGVGDAFDDSAVHELWFEIGRIYGAWLSEQEAAEVSPVAKALRSTARNLLDAAAVLSGLETGPRTHVEIEATRHTATILALDPTVGSLDRAKELISTFREEAARIGHTCMVAYADLNQRALNEGRAPMRWYDDFTALLLKLAEKVGVEPSLGKDRTTRARTGWLFEAAQALEAFLDPYMRSPSAEACGKRLERSKMRLAKAHRQNPSSG